LIFHSALVKSYDVVNKQDKMANTINRRWLYKPVPVIEGLLCSQVIICIANGIPSNNLHVMFICKVCSILLWLGFVVVLSYEICRFQFLHWHWTRYLERKQLNMISSESDPRDNAPKFKCSTCRILWKQLPTFSDLLFDGFPRFYQAMGSILQSHLNDDVYRPTCAQRARLIFLRSTHRHFGVHEYDEEYGSHDMGQSELANVHEPSSNTMERQETHPLIVSTSKLNAFYERSDKRV